MSAIQPLPGPAGAIAEQALASAKDRLATAAAPPARRAWTDDQRDLLRRLYSDTPMPELKRLLCRSDRAIYSQARLMGLTRSPEYLASEHACRLRKGDNVGAEHRFKPGATPHNKGVRGWSAGGRVRETQFKPGGRPHSWLPIGSERTSKDGYLQRKVTDTGYPPRDWVGVHILIWREHCGEIPPGHIVVFRDRNKHNLQLDNLELISRAENCRRNSIHRYPPELKEVIRLQKRLERTIRNRTDEKQDD